MWQRRGRDGDEARAPVVALHGIGKTFGSRPVLRDFDMEIGRGEIVGLLGPNGAGKTTVLRTLLGVVRPDAGTVRLFGRPPTDRDVMARVGCQFQDTSLVPLIRVREALELFASYYPRRRSGADLLRRFRLEERADAPFRSLSGGERQRLALALAFVNDPDFVALDEPGTSLDVVARAAVWRELRGMRARGGTVLLTTHSVAEAEAVADRVLLLHQGRVFASGTLRELATSYGGPERVEFTVTTNGDRRARLLTDLEERFAVHRDGERIAVAGASSEDLLRALLEVAARHGVGLASVRASAGSVEALLLRLTGETPSP